MKKKLLFSIIFVFFSKMGFSQHILSKIDSNNINKASKMAQLLLGSKIDTFDYLLLSISHRVLVLYKHNSSYKMLRGTVFYNYKEQKNQVRSVRRKTLRNHTWIDSCFNQNICDPSYSYVGSDSVFAINSKSLSHTIYIYFVLSESGTKKCEFNVPDNIPMNSDMKRSIPIKAELFQKLVRLMKLNSY